MKMKRFISALAALTMSVSCFAGLAITANAAKEDVYFIGSSSGSENYDSYATEENAAKWSNTKSVNWGTTSGNTLFGVVTGVTNIPVPADGTELSSSNYPNYLDGNVFAFQHRNNNDGAATYDFGQTVSDGTVYFKSNIGAVVSANGNYMRGTTIELLNSDQTTAVSISIGSSSSSVSQQPIIVSSGSNSKTSAGKLPVSGYGYNGFNVDLTVDIDNSTVTCVLDYMDAATSTHKTNESLTVTVPENTISGIRYLRLTAKGTANSTNYGVRLDDTTLYANTSAADLNYTVNYMTDTSDNSTIVKTTTGVAASGGIPEVIKTNFTENETKYYYVSGADDLSVSADGDIFNILVREANQYTMKVISSTGAVIKDESTVIEGNGYSYTYHKYLTDANNKVTATSDASTYSATVIPTESATITVDYTAYTGNPLYYADLGEANATDARLSNGNGNRRMGDGKNAITVKESGVYTVSYPAYKYGNSNGTVLVYRNGNAEDIVVPEKTIDYSINYLASQSAENVALYEGDEIYVKNDGANAVVDYILLEKTGDLETTVSEITEVETPIALTSVTGKVGAPTFETIAAFNEKYQSTKQLKLSVTNPYEDTYPVVTIAGTEYALTASDVTAVTENHVSTFYFEFAAESADKLKEFDTVTISYGADAKKVDKTYDFNPSTGD